MLKISNNLILKSLSFVGFVFLLAVTLSPVQTNAYVTSGGYNLNFGDGTGVSTNTTKAPSTPPTSTANTCENVAPKITSISPSSANVNSGAKRVKIVGTCFTEASVARFNSANRVTTFIDSRNLTVDLTANDMKALGKFLITAQDPKGFSNSAIFTVKSTTISKAKKSTGAVAIKATNDKIACDTSGNLASEDEGDKKESLVAAAIFGGDDLMPNSLLGWIFLFVFILLAVTLWRKIYVHDNERNAPLKHA